MSDSRPREALAELAGLRGCRLGPAGRRRDPDAEACHRAAEERPVDRADQERRRREPVRGAGDRDDLADVPVQVGLDLEGAALGRAAGAEVEHWSE